MIIDTRKDFELWNGKEVLGHIEFKTPIFGQAVVISFAPSPLKEEYGKKYETITLPVLYRCINDDGMDYTIRRCFDVRRKSKRQIERLKTWSSGF